MLKYFYAMLVTFIEKEHKEFLEREYSFKDDIASAFRVSVLMTNKLIYEMQLEENYSFAHIFNLRHRLLYQNA
ncbi:hypothetical protein [Halanaerobium sp. ST460_2HS_T2]|uniref:hypothetical protein n=1 Tax=Halanaerobium sp. ST460_2HS_T2 TaxID=2183914 RepID=UPI000DFA1954|nr:hypothetical protein [Halanaerobium sp. ST460_2HS_T2]RCW52540.1 hypothetical protein DFR80_1271 [Halanaerobium sp. ST460_2HS_T2]